MKEIDLKRATSLILLLFSLSLPAHAHASGGARCQLRLSASVINQNARLSSSSYDRPNKRSREQYSNAFGDTFERLLCQVETSGGLWIDSGSGFAVAGLTVATQPSGRARVLAINAQDFWMDFERTPQPWTKLEDLAEGLKVSLANLPVEKKSASSVQGEFFYHDYHRLSPSDWDKLKERILKFKRRADSSGRFRYAVGFAEVVLPSIRSEASLLTDLYGAYFYSAGRIQLLDLYDQALLPGGTAFIRIKTFPKRGEPGKGPDSRVLLRSRKRVSFEEYLVSNFPERFEIIQNGSVLVMTKPASAEALNLGARLQLVEHTMHTLGGMVVPYIKVREN